MRYVLIFLVSLSFNTILGAKEHQTTKNLTLETAGITKLNIDCGAGFLRVTGVENSHQIIIKAEIFANSDSEQEFQNLLDKSLNLSLKQHGSKAKLESGFDTKSSFFSGLFNNSFNARIDLTVKMPSHLLLRVDDGSGFSEIQNIKNNVFIDDGSGSLKISNIDGNLKIDDGSGELTVKKITGDVYIDDGSGTTNISKIGGSVEIDDGSGELEISEVKGDVIVDDGSGDIEIELVEGDVIIKESGGGGVDIDRVKGTIFRHDKED